jgi:signal transduction histidine kinase
MMRLLPRSLFGRLMLVLASGLIVAQLLSAAINWVERDSLLVRASGMQSAQRIADIVRLLDSMNLAERARIVGILNVPPLVVSLDRPSVADSSGLAREPRTAMVAAVLQAALGDERPVQVTMSGTPAPWASGDRRGWNQGPMNGQMRAQMGAQMGGPGMGRFPPAGISFLIQVRLLDGSWASFDTQVTQESANLPWRVLLTLGTLLATVLLVSFIAVRWVTRPLQVLASAADELGRDINHAPLSETGPAEVSRAAQAFNTMQRRLVRFIDERTRLLAAMSHDLKTPLTRMRLRAEMLDDENLRTKFEKDLVEMESMVTQTLEFMRGLSQRQPAQPVDIMALLQGLQADNEAMGRSVSIDGRVTRVWRGAPQLLNRCLSNLVDNAVLYGQRAAIRVEELPDKLIIRVRDDGPGIAVDELEKVFEPFYRLEGSRNRETGGTGLGLSIARSIAQAHGGELILRNHENQGLEAVLTLPWSREIVTPAG